jgi:hypothetical protein
MAQTATNRLKQLLLTGGITTSTDIRMGLLGTLAGHTNVPDLDTVAAMEAHADFAELTGASGYARVALTGKGVTEVDASDWALYDCDDVAFGALAAGGTVVGYFLYVFNAADASANLLGIGDLTSTPTNGSTFTVTTANGIIRLS